VYTFKVRKLTEETKLNTEEAQKHPIPAVAGIIVRDGKILLVKRANEPSKGKWSIPGGSVEWKETLTEALKREVYEETGIKIEVGRLAAVFDLITKDESGNNTYHYILVYYLAEPVGGELKAGSDASEARWVHLDDLDKYDLPPHLRDRLRQIGIDQT
jgi:8-oxo-dGTP diphosphatase